MLIHLQHTLRTHSFTADIPLHANTFTKRHFDTQWQASLDANTLTRRCSFCAHFLYIHACSVTGMPLITHAVLLHRDSLHGDTFAQRETSFYTQTLLQRDDFTLRKECMCTKGF